MSQIKGTGVAIVTPFGKDGSIDFKGLNKFFKMLEEKKYKIQYRVMLSRYRGKTVCYECNGGRLRKEANWVKINKVSISVLFGEFGYLFKNEVKTSGTLWNEFPIS